MCTACSAGVADYFPFCLPSCAAGQATPPTAINAVTTIAYMLKTNAASPALTNVLPLLGGAGFTADQADSLLGIALGVNGGAIPNTNYVAGLQVSWVQIPQMPSAHACPPKSSATPTTWPGCRWGVHALLQKFLTARMLLPCMGDLLHVWYTLGKLDKALGSGHNVACMQACGHAHGMQRTLLHTLAAASWLGTLCTPISGFRPYRFEPFGKHAVELYLLASGSSTWNDRALGCICRAAMRTG